MFGMARPGTSLSQRGDLLPSNVAVWKGIKCGAVVLSNSRRDKLRCEEQAVKVKRLALGRTVEDLCST